jgi:hypothetical protein
VNHDEWTTSNVGFAQAPDAAQFVRNLANWFTGGTPGNFLAYSTSFSLTESQLAATMTAAGHTWTVSTSISITLETLQQYDGVFLAGNSIDNAVLIDYVNAGGNVYLSGGTGVGGAVGEAAQWNTFLNYFGLNLASVYNGVYGVLPITSLHPTLSNVSSLYQGNGQSINVLDPSNPNTAVLEFSGMNGLYGVYDGNDCAEN